MVLFVIFPGNKPEECTPGYLQRCVLEKMEELGIKELRVYVAPPGAEVGALLANGGYYGCYDTAMFLRSKVGV